MLLMKGENSEILLGFFFLLLTVYTRVSSFGWSQINVISIPPVGSRDPDL